MRSHGTRVCPESNAWCPHGEKKEYTETHREEGHVKMEAEMGMMCPQAKGHQRLPAATRS